MEREPSIVIWEPSLLIWSAPVNKVAPRSKCEGSRARYGSRTIGEEPSPLVWHSMVNWRALVKGTWALDLHSGPRSLVIVMVAGVLVRHVGRKFMIVRPYSH